VVGSLCDQIHVLGGVIAYPAAGFLRQPWWVPLEYGFAAVAMVLPCGVLLRALGLRETRGTARDLVRPFLWFVAAYLATALFQRWPLSLEAALVATFALRAARGGGTAVALYGIACAAGGFFWEATLSSRGHFVYLAPHTLFGVPWWLPGLYLHAALLLRQIARLIRRVPKESAAKQS
jgi:hypothetical protein